LFPEDEHNRQLLFERVFIDHTNGFAKDIKVTLSSCQTESQDMDIGVLEIVRDNNFIRYIVVNGLMTCIPLQEQFYTEEQVVEKCIENLPGN
jgi:hypothetical protein